MSFDRENRRAGRARRLAPAVCGLALAFTPGCDDLVDVDPEDRRLAVGAQGLDVCPDPATGTGTIDVVASTFGTDGTLVEGILVTFSPSRGTVDPEMVRSDARGLASATLTGARTAALDPIVVTATDPIGNTDDVSIAWPVVPPLCAEIGFNTPGTGPFPACFANGIVFFSEVGETFDVVFSSFNACNIARARVTVDYNGDFVSFVEARSGGTLELDGMGTQTVPVTLSVSDDPVGSIVTVEVAQDPPSPPGTNVSNGPYVVLTFSSDAATPVVDDVPSASPLLITDYEFSDTDGVPYPPDDPAPEWPSVVITEPAP